MPRQHSRLTAGQTPSPEEVVVSYDVDDRGPVVIVHYTGSRGTRRTSECKWNTRVAAVRYGQQLLGLVMR